MISGMTRSQPESARGTIGIRISMPSVSSANPDADDAARHAACPPFFPASIATANMLSESGARERPACIALYSSTICR